MVEDHEQRGDPAQQVQPGQPAWCPGSRLAAAVSWEAGGDSDADGTTLLSVIDASPAQTSPLHTHIYGWIPHQVQAHSSSPGVAWAYQ
jgi:hypothetical protein